MFLYSSSANALVTNQCREFVCGRSNVSATLCWKTVISVQKRNAARMKTAIDLERKMTTVKIASSVKLSGTTVYAQQTEHVKNVCPLGRYYMC